MVHFNHTPGLLKTHPGQRPNMVSPWHCWKPAVHFLLCPQDSETQGTLQQDPGQRPPTSAPAAQQILTGKSDLPKMA